MCAAQSSDGPQDDSNYSVQAGIFNYLVSFYEQHTPPFGIIAGKAALFRMARTGTTRVSVSFGVGLSLEDNGPDLSVLAATEFTFKLHSRPCSESGGPVYQHPYLCGVSGCSADQVNQARNSGVPLELEFKSFVNTDLFNGASVELEWPVHIPDYHYGQDRNTLSMVMYSPTHPDVPMVCADLLDDRQLDGLVYYVNEDANENVPSVSNAALIRDERGFTNIEVRIANLRPGNIYPAYVHSLPCVPLSGSGAQRGGERYMRDINCYGNIGTSGCEATSDNQLHLRLRVDEQTSAASTTVQYPGLLRADAQSILLMDCLRPNGDTDETGTCDGGEPVLVCIDLVNAIPQIASSSSTADPFVPTDPVTTPVPQNKATKTPTSSPQKQVTNSPSAQTQTQNTASPSSAPFVARTGGGETAGGGSGGASSGKSRSGHSADSADSVDSPVDREPGTPSPTTPSPSAWTGHNPCPKIGMKMQTRRKGKHSKRGQLDFADDLDANIGRCCLDANGPPQSMTDFFLIRRTDGTSDNLAASAVILGTAGMVLLTAAAVLITFKRQHSQAKYEAIERDSYAVPDVASQNKVEKSSDSGSDYAMVSLTVEDSGGEI